MPTNSPIRPWKSRMQGPAEVIQELDRIGLGPDAFRRGDTQRRLAADASHDPSLQQQREAFLKHLRSRCQLLSTTCENLTNEQLVDGYLADREQVVVSQKIAIERLVEEIIRATLHLRLDPESPVPGLQQKATDFLLEGLRAGLATKFPVERLPLHASQCAQPDKHRLHRKLVGYLESSTERLVDHTFSLFEAMAAVGLLGTVKFEPADPAVCSFSFLRAEAIQNTAGERHEAKRLGDGMPYRGTDDQWWRKRKTERKQVRYGMVQYRHAFHQRLLMSAAKTPVAQAKLTFPSRVKPVVAALQNTYLANSAAVLTGNLKAERIVACDLASEPWEYTQREVIEETVPHYDPALLLGSWVLSAWCPVEQQRAEDDEECAALVGDRRLLGRSLFVGQVLAGALGALFFIVGLISVVRRAVLGAPDFGCWWLLPVGLCFVPLLSAFDLLVKRCSKASPPSDDMGSGRLAAACDFASAAGLAVLLGLLSGLAGIYWRWPVLLLSLSFWVCAYNWSTKVYRLYRTNPPGLETLFRIAPIASALVMVLSTPVLLWMLPSVLGIFPLLITVALGTAAWRFARQTFPGPRG